MLDLIKDVQFGVGGFLEHGEGVFDDKAEMHGYDMEVKTKKIKFR